MNRIHIYKLTILKTSIDFLENFYALTPNKYDLYCSKNKVLIEKYTIRDLYDFYSMIKMNVFAKIKYRTVRKV